VRLDSAVAGRGYLCAIVYLAMNPFLPFPREGIAQALALVGWCHAEPVEAWWVGLCARPSTELRMTPYVF